MKRQSVQSTIIDLAKQGYTTQQIREQVGCPMQSIYSALHLARSNGELPKNDTAREQQKKELLASIQALLGEGLGCRAIARKLGITRGKLAYAIGQLNPKRPATRRELDISLVNSIRKFLNDGLSVQDIAHKLQTDKETIRQCMRAARRQGIEMPYAPTRTKPGKAKNELLYMRYVERLTLEEISRRKNIPVNSLWRFFMNRPVVELARERKPYVPTQITPEVEKRILALRNREHYNIQAIADETGCDVGEIMEVVRQDKLVALLA